MNTKKDFVWKDYKYNRILNGCANEQGEYPLDILHPQVKDIILAAEIDPQNPFNSPAFRIAEDISEMLYGMEGFGKIDLIVTDYNGMKAFAKSPMGDLFIMQPFFETEDQVDFIYEVRRIEEERGLKSRPIGGYQYELKRAFITWPAKEHGEDLDFYIGSYYFSGEDRSSIVSGWGYFRDLLKKWLSKTNEGLR